MGSLSATSLAGRLKADWMILRMASSGLNSYLETEDEPLTVFAPLNSATSSLSVHNRQILEEGKCSFLFHPVRIEKRSI